MRSGALRHSLVIMTASATDSVIGKGMSISYSTGDTIRGAVSALSGNESQRGGGTNTEVTHEVKIRYHSSITARDKLVFGSKTLQILSVLKKDEINHEMILSCKEIV